jgi:predicted ATPase
MEWFVILSGCSGGRKSTLLAELGRCGHSIVEEPGRRIVKQELLSLSDPRHRPRGAERSFVC